VGDNYSRITQTGQVSPHAADPTHSRDFGQSSVQAQKALSESVFHSTLTVERRRTERSGKPFVLMLLDANSENGSAAGILKHALEVIAATKRETDLIGWFKDKAILGVIFLEVSELPVTDTLRRKIEATLVKHLGREKAAKISISVHEFPESKDGNYSGRIAESKPHTEVDWNVSPKRLPLVAKRVMKLG
jgi:hypothetical protein